MPVKDYCGEVTSNFILMPEIKLSENAIAIKDLRIYKVHGDNKPKYINFYFDMYHYKGWFEEICLPSDECWKNHGTIEDDNIEDLALIMHHELIDDDCDRHDYKFRLMNLIVKN